MFAAFLRTEPAASAACFDEASLHESLRERGTKHGNGLPVYFRCLFVELERIPAEAVQPDIFEAQTRVWNVSF